MADVFCFLSSLPSSHSHHGSNLSSLFLSNSVSPVRDCLITCWERFRGTQEEDDRGPLNIPSSLMRLHALRSPSSLQSHSPLCNIAIGHKKAASQVKLRLLHHICLII